MFVNITPPSYAGNRIGIFGCGSNLYVHLLRMHWSVICRGYWRAKKNIPEEKKFNSIQLFDQFMQINLNLLSKLYSWDLKSSGKEVKLVRDSQLWKQIMENWIICNAELLSLKIKCREITWTAIMGKESLTEVNWYRGSPTCVFIFVEYYIMSLIFPFKINPYWIGKFLRFKLSWTGWENTCNGWT